MNTSSAANLCSLCGEKNYCAIELTRETGVKQAPCWCTSLMFDANLLARVPPEKRNLVCICEKCAQSAQTSSNK